MQRYAVLADPNPHAPPKIRISRWPLNLGLWRDAGASPEDVTAFAAANGYDFNATEWSEAAGVEGEDLGFLGRVRSDTYLPVTMLGSWACCEARVDSCASTVGQCQRMICPLLIWAGGTKPMRTHVSKVSPHYSNE